MVRGRTLLSHAPQVAQVDNQASGTCNATRLSFKGLPGQDGYQRRVLIVESMMQYPPEKIFGVKDRGAIYEAVTEGLNEEPLFNGALKFCTTRDKWLSVLREVDKIAFFA